MQADRHARLAAVLSRRLGHVRVAIEAVYHRHNVSAILRTCEAMGLQHVHLVEGHFRPSKGAARGAERWLDIHRHASPAEAIAELRRLGFAIWIADLAEGSKPPEEVPLDRPVCLWMGAELVGVGADAKAAADGVVTVPMYGLAQSLNVSVAAALTVRPVADRARRIGDAALLPEGERRAIWNAWMEREQAMVAGLAERVEE